MNAIAIIVLIFAVLGAADKLFGNKLGIGKEFEKGFELFAVMTFSMLGILVLAPAVGVWLSPFFEWFYNVFNIDPSVIPASLFANDMGGATLAQQICRDEQIGLYNAFIISSMMGCLISYTLPVSMAFVKKELHGELFLGLLCGIVTIPVGCFVAGLMCGIAVPALLMNLLPLLALSAVTVAALIFCRKICIKVFAVFGKFMEVVALLGLLCGMFTFLTKIEICEHFDTLENAAMICVNACVTLSGALPFVFILSKILVVPLNKLGSKIGINGFSTVALLSTTVTSTPTFSIMNSMDKKGVVLNAAFAVSAGFALGAHLAFTMAFDSTYIVPMLVGKFVSGILAVVLALLLYKEKPKKERNA